MIFNKIIFHKVMNYSLLFFSLANGVAFAHGSMEVPRSRVYQCYHEGPENPQSDACKAVVKENGTQALYDWNEVNQSHANGNHKSYSNYSNAFYETNDHHKHHNHSFHSQKNISSNELRNNYK
ncbi:hypothetical protein AXG55_07270 [Silvanigrella aquatica]|uniref:Chitin-binding type-4 domain-containing protein n=1 Tax=Silvanigrella aquatica TaxID=1915309 RepID=A0A1L4D0J2_9BACT|nr:lytic polysaccharide monooxygenase [Silvanigrella aquatica]APJ03716.1 hypothetical protein AXG55_07270 [Silvanigrella aquatica]